MKPINLNIDSHARSKDESKRVKEREVDLVRKMCGEFRDVAKLNTSEEKEERQREMEKVRSARTYFKGVDKYRSQSMSAVLRIRTNMEDITNVKDSSYRLSQFEPGKIDKKFRDMFCEPENTEESKSKPPKKKIITLDQVIKKDKDEDNDNRAQERQNELEEVRQSRIGLTFPKQSPELMVGISEVTKSSETPLKMRWNPKKNRTEEKAQSLDLPNNLNIKNIYPKEARSNTTDSKENLEEELRQIRDSRTTPLTKRWKPKQYKQERSKSAHVLQRAKLPDDSWLKEKSNTRLEEDRMNVR